MNKNNNLIQFIILIILIILIITGIGSTHYILGKMPDKISEKVAEKVTAKMLEVEYNKVGGMENYVKLNKIQKEQITTFLKQYETKNGKIKAPNIKAKNPDKSLNSGNKISLDKLKKIKDGTYVLGNPNAEITWIEYSDLECPYCKRLHESGTIEKILKDYDGKVNFIYKQFPLGFHPKAQMQAEAALCVGELAGKDKYYDFIKEIYAGSKTNGNSYTKQEVAKIADSIGVDGNKVLSCINSGKYTQEAQRQLQEGKNNFGITGTPGNVLINNKTGEWDKLPGAYPADSFKQKINSLLK